MSRFPFNVIQLLHFIVSVADGGQRWFRGLVEEDLARCHSHMFEMHFCFDQYYYYSDSDYDSSLSSGAPGVVLWVLHGSDSGFRGGMSLLHQVQRPGACVHWNEQTNLHPDDGQHLSTPPGGAHAFLCKFLYNIRQKFLICICFVF